MSADFLSSKRKQGFVQFQNMGKKGNSPLEFMAAECTLENTKKARIRLDIFISFDISKISLVKAEKGICNYYMWINFFLKV